MARQGRRGRGHRRAVHTRATAIRLAATPGDRPSSKLADQDAEAGNVNAQYNLGLLLVTMLDPPEAAQARIWWIRAASGGHVDAQKLIEGIEDH